MRTNRLPKQAKLVYGSTIPATNEKAIRMDGSFVYSGYEKDIFVFCIKVSNSNVFLLVAEIDDINLS